MMPATLSMDNNINILKPKEGKSEPVGVKMKKVQM